MKSTEKAEFNDPPPLSPTVFTFNLTLPGCSFCAHNALNAL